MGEDGPKGDMGEKVSEQTESFCLLHHLCSEEEIYEDATMTFAVYALVGWLSHSYRPIFLGDSLSTMWIHFQENLEWRL